MSDACKACRKLFENLRLEGNDVELGCEWCGATDADSLQFGISDENGHEIIMSVNWADIEGGDADGVR